MDIDDEAEDKQVSELVADVLSSTSDKAEIAKRIQETWQSVRAKRQKVTAA